MGCNQFIITIAYAVNVVAPVFTDELRSESALVSVQLKLRNLL